MQNTKSSTLKATLRSGAETWITNHPKSLKGLWPRRAGCVYFEGEPKATGIYTKEELIRQGLVGIYINIPEDEYRKLPIVKNWDELAVYERTRSS